VLDVGTGSGILSIGAVKFGASRVVAIDIDPQAVEVAAKNLALNQADTTVDVSTTPIEQIAGRFDLVLANILAEELVRLAPELVKRLERGGFLVLSGILTEKEALVCAGFAQFGLAPAATFRDAEWSCLVYRREL
jgi:ribosomal protein L11 methyltransferase